MKRNEKIQKLVKACKKREFKAQRMLYDTYVDTMYYVVKRYVNDEYYIANIVQDIFLKIFNNIDKYDSIKGAFSTWINTIAVRETINHLKKQKNFMVYNQNLKVVKSTEEGILDKLNADDILEVLSSIHEKYRTVFNLYEIDGFSHKEIAEILGITDSSSRTYLTRAKKILQERINQMNNQKFTTYGR